MPLPGSGQISMSQIMAEFGGSGQTPMTKYYRGKRVPDRSPNSGVPTSGQISIGQFHGASAGGTAFTIQPSGTTINYYGYAGGSAGSFGSRSPSSYAGATLTGVLVRTISVKGVTSYFFDIYLSGNRAIGFFNNVFIENYGAMATSAATRTYLSDPNETSWTWSIPGLVGSISDQFTIILG